MTFLYASYGVPAFHRFSLSFQKKLVRKRPRIGCNANSRSAVAPTISERGLRGMLRGNSHGCMRKRTVNSHPCHEIASFRWASSRMRVPGSSVKPVDALVRSKCADFGRSTVAVWSLLEKWASKVILRWMAPYNAVAAIQQGELNAYLAWIFAYWTTGSVYKEKKN